jgi:outer membrane protein TolC
MPIPKRRAGARWIRIIGGVLCWPLAASIAWPAESPTDPLTLEDAVQLAVAEQPALRAEAATIRALREEAVAERQLPDPQLIGGVMQMPVTSDDAFSLRDDDFTSLSVGLAQEFPRAAKRELRGARLDQEAAASEAALSGVELQLRRDVGLAYLDVLEAVDSARLVDELRREAERQQATAGIALTASRGTQAEVLAATVDAEVVADRGRAFRQQERAARATLARWIGPAADRPLGDGYPSLPDPAPLDDLVSGLPRHPQLAEHESGIRMAVTELKLAETGLKPDWRLEVRYDHRLEFSDLVTVMVGVDLPFFGDQRQDRRASAARERVTAATAGHDDALRAATATLTASYRNWQVLAERLRRYDDVLLPGSRQRVEAAVSAYRSGQGNLTGVLDARRSLLESELMRTDLRVDLLKERLTLQYFESESSR